MMVSDYSEKAQPYLNAIAEAVFSSVDVRNWLLSRTPVQKSYTDSSVYLEEQRKARWRNKPTKQPFWANYHCGRDRKCICRIAESHSLESDAIFFFHNSSSRVLAVHVEFKHTGEPFKFGQPEAYPLRAACFAKIHGVRQTLNPHDDWVTVLFCGPESLSDPRVKNFQRVIVHAEAELMINNYPVK